MSIEELKEILQEKYPEMEVREIQYEDIVFEERVRLKCCHCKNYKEKWTCPGKLPELDYRKIISEYAHMAVLIGKVPMKGNVTQEQFREAVVKLHKAMLYLEGELFKRNNAMAESFIGCSCQLCEEGCAAEKCRHPEQARVPWDATGCNVVKTLERIGVKVEFPAKEYIYQYGLFVW